jgi:uncharacterized protein YkwD
VANKLAVKAAELLSPTYLLELTKASMFADLRRVLDLHNEYRAKHSVGPLAWDSTLQQFAENWAQRCVFEHSESDYGENLAKGQRSFEEAVRDWYEEVR